MQEGDYAGKGSSVYFYFTLVSLAIVKGGEPQPQLRYLFPLSLIFLPLYSPLSLHVPFLLLTSVLMVNMSGVGGLWSETTAEGTVIVQTLWMCRWRPSLLAIPPSTPRPAAAQTELCGGTRPDFSCPGLQRCRLRCGQTSPPSSHTLVCPLRVSPTHAWGLGFWLLPFSFPLLTTTKPHPLLLSNI